jgi:hypothetical protein
VSADSTASGVPGTRRKVDMSVRAYGPRCGHLPSG